MKKFSQVFKDKFSHFYAVLLIFLIPVLIIVNGLWRINVYQKNINIELNNKVKLVQAAVSSSIGDSINNSLDLTQKINQISQADPQIGGLTLVDAGKNKFSVIASTSPELSGIEINDSDLIKIGSTNEIVTKTFKGVDNKRTWLAIGPVRDSGGKINSFLAVSLQSSDIDILSRAAINQSLVSLVITVFIVFLLLLNHFRYFEYFVNYRKIQEIDRMKDEFISMVSHELKTPITTVKGYLDMMFQGLTGKFDDKAKEHLQKVSANVQRLDLLVSELLDVSRLEQERMQFDMQPLDIGKVVQDVISEMEDEAAKKGLKLAQHPLDKFPPIFADPDRLHQVFENLVSNSIKYTFKGSVEINYKIDKNKIRATVKDTGIGMAPADMKRLFERFYRIKNEKTMEVSGTGLGLWITKTITKRMNGTIEVSSKENIGTEFTVVLPIIQDKE